MLEVLKDARCSGRHRVFTLAVILFLALVSCRREYASWPEYSVSISDSLPFSQFDQYSTVIKVISLESPERGFTDALSLRMDDEIIILNDRKMNSFYVYDGAGSLLHSFSRTGNGPGEYLSSFRFDYHKDSGEILVYDPMKAGILHYSMDGAFICIDSLGRAPVSSFKSFHGKTYLDNKFNRFEGDEGFSIIVLDSLKNVIQHYLPYSLSWDLRINPRESFYTVGDTVVYQPPFSQAVYSITEDGRCSERFSIDFGKNNLQESTIFAKHDSSIDYFDMLSESGAVLYLNCHENKEYVYLDFSVMESEYVALIRKHDGNSRIFKIDGNSCKSRFKPLAVVGDCFVSIDQPDSDNTCLVFMQLCF